MTSQIYPTHSKCWYQSNSMRNFGLLISATIAMLAINPEAHAASLNLSTWNRFGDVQASGSQANLSNAFNDGNDDPVNRNLSGVSPLLTGDLESSLNLSFGLLGLDATEGSAIQTTLNGIMAGDRLEFNWTLQTFDIQFVDRAFVVVNNNLFNLNSGNLFSYQFTSNGNYQFVIGLVDVDDTVGSSILKLSNAKFTPIPSPAMLPGVVAIGLKTWRRKRHHKQNSSPAFNAK